MSLLDGAMLYFTSLEEQRTMPRCGWETVDLIVKPSEIYDGEKAALLIANAKAVLDAVGRILGEVNC